MLRILVNVEAVAPAPSLVRGKGLARRRRLTPDQAIKTFFGSNALVAIVVLALITIFLFREGSGFFGQNLVSLRLYRRAGLEYVDIIRAQAERHAALSRQLSDIRLREVWAHADQAALEKFDQFGTGFSDTGDELSALLSEANDQALALRETFVRSDGQSASSYADNETPEEAVPMAAAVNPVEGMAALRSAGSKFVQISDSMKAKIDNLLARPPAIKRVNHSKNGKRTPRRISSSFQQRRRSFARGIRTNRCRRIARSRRFFSDQIG